MPFLVCWSLAASYVGVSYDYVLQDGQPKELILFLTAALFGAACQKAPFSRLTTTSLIFDGGATCWQTLNLTFVSSRDRQFKSSLSYPKLTVVGAERKSICHATQPAGPPARRTAFYSSTLWPREKKVRSTKLWQMRKCMYTSSRFNSAYPKNLAPIYFLSIHMYFVTVFWRCGNAAQFRLSISHEEGRDGGGNVILTKAIFLFGTAAAAAGGNFSWDYHEAEFTESLSPDLNSRND